MSAIIMTDQKIPGVTEDVAAMYQTVYMGFASFTLLIWDHVDTFVTEVEYIWKGKKTLLVYLFLINRYLTPLGFMVNLFAYLSPVWTPERCHHFIRFEGAMTVIGINIVALMMFLRVYALYKGHTMVLGVVGFLYLCQITMNAWLLTKGVAVVHNPQSGVHACTMIFDPSISAIASSSAWLPLLYDTVVLGLTLNRTIPSLRNKTTFYIMKRLLEDGLIYYTAIFSVTAVLTIMIIAAPPDIKNITAQLELLLTVTMMSRITLNLKRSVGKFNNTPHWHVHAQLPSMFSRQSIRFAHDTLQEEENGNSKWAAPKDWDAKPRARVPEPQVVQLKGHDVNDPPGLSSRNMEMGRSIKGDVELRSGHLDHFERSKTLPVPMTQISIVNPGRPAENTLLGSFHGLTNPDERFRAEVSSWGDVDSYLELDDDPIQEVQLEDLTESRVKFQRRVEF